MVTRIALVSSIASSPLDEDLGPLSSALSEAGADPRVEHWDDDAVDWGAFDAAVIRSTWDYHERPDAFREWARRTASLTLVLNPLPIIEWNADKRYLIELADSGVPTIPTVFADHAEEVVWPDSPEVVIKPRVSAGSQNTARFPSDDTKGALELADRIWERGGTVMIQPYVSGVDLAGEHALIYLDGHYSHSFRKGPILHPGDAPTDDLFAAEEIGPAEATTAQREVAEAAIATAVSKTGERPAYARVDVVPADDGPLLLELELIEPSLYHHAGQGSASRFARVVLDRIEAKPASPDR